MCLKSEEETMQATQDIQFHDVKYIIDKTYEQRDLVRARIAAYRTQKAAAHYPEAHMLKDEIKRSYALYKIYRQQMQRMYDEYLNAVNAQVAYTPLRAEKFA